MTEEAVCTLLKNHHRYEVEMNILRDCSSSASEGELEKNRRYRILKRRMALVSHWLSLIDEAEAAVLRIHLIEGVSWNGLCHNNDREEIRRLPNDRRSLQRLQSRALAKIVVFMEEQFGDSMDHLL